MRTITLKKSWAGHAAGTTLRVLAPADPAGYRPKEAVDPVRAAQLEADGYIAKPKTEPEAKAAPSAAPAKTQTGKGGK